MPAPVTDTVMLPPVPVPWLLRRSLPEALVTVPPAAIEISPPRVTTSFAPMLSALVSLMKTPPLDVVVPAFASSVVIVVSIWPAPVAPTAWPAFALNVPVLISVAPLVPSTMS